VAEQQRFLEDHADRPALGGTPARDLPSTATSPALAVSKPATTLSTVVFPQPDGPSRAVRVPAGTVRSTPSTTGTPGS
jgi:hypothetical protein